MYQNSVNVFCRHVYLLSYLGVTIPLYGNCQTWINQAYFLFVQIMLTVNTIFQVCAMLQGHNTLVRRSITLVLFLISIVTQVKLVVIKTNAKLLGRLFEALDTPGATDSTIEIMRKINVIIRVYVAILVAILAAWLAYPWLTGDLNIPLPYWFPFIVNTKLKYMIAYSFMSIILAIECYTQEAVDTMLLLVAGQICRRLDTVCMVLKTLGEDEPLLMKSWKSNKTNIDSSSLRIVRNATFSRDETVLKEAVREHVDIIRLIRTFDAVLDDLFLGQVMKSTILSTMYLFVTSKSDNLLRDFPKITAVLLATYLQFFMYCWLGQEISQHNDNVHRNLYISKWYKCGEKVMKSLVIIETFTKTKFRLEGGHLFRIDLGTFVMVLQESFSYFMVLRAVLKSSLLSVKY